MTLMTILHGDTRAGGSEHLLSNESGTHPWPIVTADCAHPSSHNEGFFKFACLLWDISNIFVGNMNQFYFIQARNDVKH